MPPEPASTTHVDLTGNVTPPTDPMSRALFVNVPAHGHVNPTLPLVAELVSRGERVDYALTPDFGPAVVHAGAGLVPYQSTMAQALSQLGSSPGPDRLLATLVREGTHVLPQLLDRVRTDPPDYLVHDPFCFWAPLLATGLGVPAFRTYATYAPNRQTLREPAFRRFAYWVESAPPSEVFEEAARAFGARFGVAPPTPADIFLGAAELNIVFLPRLFHPGGEAYDDRWVFVGPSVGPRSAGGQDLPAAQDGPLLFVSLGTIFNDQAAFFLACLDAFAGTRWQVVLAVGDRVDLDAIGPVPANASVHRRVAQLDVLSRASVFITHGGMNSTMEGILAGVPLVVVPQQEEQAVTAERVSELGLGTHLMPDDATSEALAEAVARVCADEGIRERVAAMRRAAVEAGGPARAAEEILRRVPSRPSG